MWRLAIEYVQVLKIPEFFGMEDEYLRRKFEDKEEFSQVRKEVFLMIQICCYQERALIVELMKNLQAELLTDPTNQEESTWVWKTWPECS